MNGSRTPTGFARRSTATLTETSSASAARPSRQAPSAPLASTGVAAEIELVEVKDADAAQRLRFLGSPTVRIDGVDVEPAAGQRSEFGLKCRLFATPDGLAGTPADEWVLAALRRAEAGSRS